MRLVDDALRRLPASTNSWSCPWFLMLVWFAWWALVAALVSRSTVGLLCIVPLVGLVGFAVCLRRRGVGKCPV